MVLTYSIFYREHPDHAALRHVGVGFHRLIETRDHLLGIHAPARLHGDVLYAVDHVGDRHAGDAAAGVRREEAESRRAGCELEKLAEDPEPEKPPRLKKKPVQSE